MQASARIIAQNRTDSQLRCTGAPAKALCRSARQSVTLRRANSRALKCLGSVPVSSQGANRMKVLITGGGFLGSAWGRP